jgi:hypothetical protein
VRAIFVFPLWLAFWIWAICFVLCMSDSCVQEPGLHLCCGSVSAAKDFFSRLRVVHFQFPRAFSRSRSVVRFLLRGSFSRPIAFAVAVPAAESPGASCLSSQLYFLRCKISFLLELRAVHQFGPWSPSLDPIRSFHACAFRSEAGAAQFSCCRQFFFRLGLSSRVASWSCGFCVPPSRFGRRGSELGVAACW